MWQVYIIECDDGSLYTGITKDVERRYKQHLDGTGAKYFRGRKPKAVRYREPKDSKSAALIREAEIKKFSRAQKLALIKR